jgi:hypothetical protein
MGLVPLPGPVQAIHGLAFCPLDRPADMDTDFPVAGVPPVIGRCREGGTSGPAPLGAQLAGRP